MVFAYLKKNHLYKEESEFSILEGNGQFNGYVGITPDEKPLPQSWMSGRSLDIENPLDEKIKVHGGITFDSIWDEERWFPKEEIIEYPLTEIPENVGGSRIIGFDTSHIWSRPDMDYEWCKRECLCLRDQILELLENG